MFEWSQTHAQIRTMIRGFIEAEIKPNLEELEHGDTPPYEVLRKFASTFGLEDMAKERFDSQIAKARAREAGETIEKKELDPESAMNMAAMRLLPIIELCRYSPGMVTALGVSMGLTANAIMARGTIAQKERWALDLMTLEKIGAWAITEPGSGSDAFGSMAATARRDGEGYVLNGQKTFITNGPYADTIVFICKLDEGNPPAERKVLSFVLEGMHPGVTRSKPLRKMGLHSSPTGELFFEDVRVGKDQLLGETEEAGGGRSGAKETFTDERTAVAAMALGIVERCLELSVDYARTRVQFGKPIGEFQLVQLKLAKMEVARQNIQNLVFQQIEMAGAGKTMSLAAASACKLYSAQAAMECALEAVQLFGGNGYMAEFAVEQLCRDAKVLQIYGGTDEIQITHIARDLLRV